MKIKQDYSGVELILFSKNWHCNRKQQISAKTLWYWRNRRVIKSLPLHYQIIYYYPGSTRGVAYAWERAGILLIQLPKKCCVATNRANKNYSKDFLQCSLVHQMQVIIFISCRTLKNHKKNISRTPLLGNKRICGCDKIKLFYRVSRKALHATCSYCSNNSNCHGIMAFFCIYSPW